ncbi:MAG: DNA methylase [Deltaproteobacteria bacterium]|nr:DNA methylase [Deltaproteobacteria bacterium]
MSRNMQKRLLGKGKTSDSQTSGPVECLGLTFPSDEARRQYFLEKLREKLQDPDFRKIEGFPIGSDEDILALSDPPYFTACPNPFVEGFIKLYGKPYDPATDNYRREPFAADVSEGKNDPIYNAHSYHTKVPHKAIMRYILHYTEPEDIVFDGFCGTGMTGVAAQLCGERVTLEALGFKVEKDDTIYHHETDEDGTTGWKVFSKLGARRAILNDLSPAATFIANNYNTRVDVVAFEREVTRILKEVEDECGWMYETIHTDGKIKGRINYAVWSDVFVCPECTREVVFWEAAVDEKAGQVRDEFPCPHCRVLLTKRRMERVWVIQFDKAINQTISQAKQVPVLINYSVSKKRYEKPPDAFDLALIEKIEQSDIPYWFPTDRMPEGFNTEQPKVSHGITHVHHFYTKRNLWVLGRLFADDSAKWSRMVALDCFSVISKMSRFRVPAWVFGTTGPMKGMTAGTLYVPSLPGEQNVLNAFAEKAKMVARSCRAAFFLESKLSCLQTRSAGTVMLQEPYADYIFTDPPFGGNIMYSELNFLLEAWLKVFTNNKPEAIENQVQGKGLLEYQRLMTQCFQEYHRVLKPGRWMTVEFHNSKNSVWNAIQEALQHAGFVIADIRTLNKQQGTFKQVTSSGAVKQDLIISAYKPNGGLEDRFKITAGTEEGSWEFIRTHLRQLPVFVTKDGRAEVTAERQNYLLFDRMVAFHVQRGVTVPLSAAEFYQGLAQRFPERDGMYFLPEQVAEYDKKRLTVKEVLQLELFVIDESSAIQWLRQQLIAKPQTFQDLHPQFLREIGGWQKHEKPLELSELLEDNFICYDGRGEVPSQIHSYLSSNFKDLRNLPKDDPTLRTKARDRWYIPDPNKATDLERLRERRLMKDFQEYRETKQKKLKVFRLEAVRTGFKKAWQERDYPTIIEVARKIPETILQEDPKLLMWYDQALTRTDEGTTI